MSKRSKALGTYGSFKPRNTLKNRFGRIIRVLLLIFLVYQFITVFVVASFIVKTSAMEPGILQGQRILSAPIVTGASLKLLNVRVPGFRDPERGDLVLIRPGNAEQIAWYLVLFDPVVRFFTLQNKTIIPGANQNWNNQIAVKRIIGLPGDTVKMSGFKFLIKQGSELNFIMEDTLIFREYSLTIPERIPDMDPSIPFSGNMEEIRLLENQYLVANDNRTVFYDSRFYGPISRDNILGHVFLSYWPGVSFR
jgi:signal peptidase I